LIKAVQVYGPDILNGHVADGLIGALHEMLIAGDGAVFRAGALLQGNDIGGVFGEGLPVVQGIALLNTALEVSGGPLDGLLDLTGSHAGFGLIGHSVADALSGSIEAAGDADPVGDAGLAGDLLNSCHVNPLAWN